LIRRCEREYLRFVGAEIDPDTGEPIDPDEACARALDDASPDHQG
jgi:hypothetical protein